MPTKDRFTAKTNTIVDFLGKTACNHHNTSTDRHAIDKSFEMSPVNASTLRLVPDILAGNVSSLTSEPGHEFMDHPFDDGFIPKT